MFTVVTKFQSVGATYGFPQGNTIDRDVYLQLPKDKRGKGLVSKLKYGIYESNDEPRVWYDE